MPRESRPKQSQKLRNGHKADARHFGFLSAAAKRTYEAIRTHLGAVCRADQTRSRASPPPVEPTTHDDETDDPTQPLAADSPPKKHCCPRCNVVMHRGTR